MNLLERIETRKSLEKSNVLIKDQFAKQFDDQSKKDYNDKKRLDCPTLNLKYIITQPWIVAQ